MVCTMEIMHTMASEAIARRPKRRYYSPELKFQGVAQCQVSGASVAGAALTHGIKANIVHRWLREQTAQSMPAVRNEFVALALPPPYGAATCACIRVSDSSTHHPCGGPT